MNKLLSITCLIIGSVLLGIIQPMFDLVVTQALEQGGLLAAVTFIMLLAVGGVTFLYLGIVLWRR